MKTETLTIPAKAVRAGDAHSDLGRVHHVVIDQLGMSTPLVRIEYDGGERWYTENQLLTVTREVSATCHSAVASSSSANAAVMNGWKGLTEMTPSRFSPQQLRNRANIFHETIETCKREMDDAYSQPGAPTERDSCGECLDAADVATMLNQAAADAERLSGLEQEIAEFKRREAIRFDGPTHCDFCGQAHYPARTSVNGQAGWKYCYAAKSVHQHDSAGLTQAIDRTLKAEAEVASLTAELQTLQSECARLAGIEETALNARECQKRAESDADALRAGLREACEHIVPRDTRERLQALLASAPARSMPIQSVWLTFAGNYHPREVTGIYATEALANVNRRDGEGVEEWEVSVASAPARSAETTDDESRCAVCGWTLVASVRDGCVRGNCSMRPLPKTFYAPERAVHECPSLAARSDQEQ